MASEFNIGRILPVFKGNWSKATTYDNLDVVLSTHGNSYVALKSNTNVNPESDTNSNWTMLASHGSFELSGQQLDEALKSALAGTDTKLTRLGVSDNKPTINFYFGKSSNPTSSITETSSGSLNIPNSLTVGGTLNASVSSSDTSKSLLAYSLPDGYDLNNVPESNKTKTNVLNGVTVINGPFGNSVKVWGTLETTYIGAGNATQKLIDSNTADVYVRGKNSGNYTSWRKLNSSPV